MIIRSYLFRTNELIELIHYIENLKNNYDRYEKFDRAAEKSVPGKNGSVKAFAVNLRDYLHKDKHCNTWEDFNKTVVPTESPDELVKYASFIWVCLDRGTTKELFSNVSGEIIHAIEKDTKINLKVESV